MNKKCFIPLLIAFVVACLPAANAQDRISDLIMVSIPDGVYVGDNALKAGEYRIKQIPSANNPRILQFIDKDGNSVEATVSAIPALNNTGAESTVLELKRAGGRQYVSKVWIEGKAYGYEIPAPDVNAGQAGSASLSAQFTPAPKPVEVAVAKPEPTPAPEPQPEVKPAPEPVREPAPVEAKPEPAPEPAPAPAPAPPPEMPSTADGSIAGFLMGGGFLLGCAALLGKRSKA